MSPHTLTGEVQICLNAERVQIWLNFLNQYVLKFKKLGSGTIDYYIHGSATDDVRVLLIGDYSVTRMSFVFKFETLVS